MADEWNCRKCTFHHKYPAARCTMCNALRVSKQRMREFAVGGTRNKSGKNNNSNGGDSSSSADRSNNESWNGNGSRNIEFGSANVNYYNRDGSTKSSSSGGDGGGDDDGEDESPGECSTSLVVGERINCPQHEQPQSGGGTLSRQPITATTTTAAASLATTFTTAGGRNKRALPIADGKKKRLIVANPYSKQRASLPARGVVYNHDPHPKKSSRGDAARKCTEGRPPPSSSSSSSLEKGNNNNLETGNGSTMEDEAAVPVRDGELRTAMQVVVVGSRNIATGSMTRNVPGNSDHCKNAPGNSGNDGAHCKNDRLTVRQQQSTQQSQVQPSPSPRMPNDATIAGRGTRTSNPHASKTIASNVSLPQTTMTPPPNPAAVPNRVNPNSHPSSNVVTVAESLNTIASSDNGNTTTTMSGRDPHPSSRSRTEHHGGATAARTTDDSYRQLPPSSAPVNATTSSVHHHHHHHQHEQRHHRQQQQQQRPPHATNNPNTTSNTSTANATTVHRFFAGTNARRLRSYEEGPVPLCPEARRNWIYPEDDEYPERIYQLEMSRSAILQNTLVSLPTGLGKTLIAAVVMYNYYRWFPTGKVVFCAPTRPLVSQQIHACYKIMGIPEHHTAEISGRTHPASRAALWLRKRVFFCTPQTLAKDIEGRRCPARSIVCVVMDEAHRATGEHANAVLARSIGESGARFRLVGLSATPGTDIRGIQSVLDTLNISKIECRTEDDPDVKKYIHDRHEEVIVVKQPDIIKSLDAKFGQLMAPTLARLREESAVSHWLRRDSANLKPYSVMLAHREYLEATGGDRRLDAQFKMLHELTSVRGNLKQHGVQMANRKLDESSRKPFMGYVARTPAFKSLARDVNAACGSGGGGSPSSSSLFENNPKLTALAKVLAEHFERKGAMGESTRVIVFSQWRESVVGIVDMLNSQHHGSSLIKPARFIGQASKKATNGGNNAGSISSGSNAGRVDAAGMNQKQQQRVLRQFGEGVYNVLVCTCVGEEGLDIGEVDLIVNFDVMKSPIRSIQRSGRTGRKRNGRVVFLVAEGQEERSYAQSVTNTKKILRVLSKPSVFKLCDNTPMFPAEPDLLRKKMLVSNFHLSQVGGHTPKGRGRNKGGTKKRHSQTKAVDSNWRLDPAEEEERRTLFGQLPPSSCREHESRRKYFPPSLKRRYLNSRNQSIYTRRLRKGKAPAAIMGAGRSSAILQQLEKRHYVTDSDNAAREVHTSMNEISDNIERSVENLVESIDSEVDFRSIDVGSDRSVACEKNHLDGAQSSNTNRNHSDDTLDGIFGPIVEDEKVDPLQMANLFDEAHHQSCAVVAPPGMALDESDEESESDSSTMSETSMNDDLCAFFEQDNSRDLRVESRRKHHDEDATSAMQTPFSDHSDVDFGAEDQFDFGTPRSDVTNCENEADDDDAGSSNQVVADASKCFESTLVIEGGDHTSERDFSSAATKQTTDKEEGSTDLVLEKENINFDLSLSPIRQEDQSRVEVCHPYQPPDNEVGEDCVGSKMPPEDGKGETAVERLSGSFQLNEEDVGCANQCNDKEGNTDLVREKGSINFQLSLSPICRDDQSSVEVCQPHQSLDNEVGNECVGSNMLLEDAKGATADERLVTSIQPNKDDVDYVNQCNIQNELEEVQSPVVASFHLPTPPPSSDESDDDCSDSNSARQNEHSNNIDAMDGPQRESFVDLFEGNAVSDETGSSKAVSFFQLPTQDSSSSEDDDDEDDDENDNVNIESNQSPSNEGHISKDDFMPPSQSPMGEIAADAYACENTPGGLKGQSSSDQWMADTPEPKGVHFNSTSFNKMSAAEDLTDTPIKAAFSVNDTKSSGINLHMSLESLTDTPLQSRKNPVQQRKSFDILTNTPLLCRKNAGQRRKRLRPAPTNDDNGEKPDNQSANKLQRKDRVKQRIEDKYRCRFLDCEAANDDSEESDEERAIKEIEDEERSLDGFINDSSQLGYTQDELDRVDADVEVEEIEGVGGEESVLHRQFDHQHDMNQRFNTPVFNRRMRNPASQSQSAESSQKGLGNMNFIRSVLEHAAAGGDADQLEEEYDRLARNNLSQDAHSASIDDSPMGLGSHSSSATSPTHTTSHNSIQAGIRSQQQATTAAARSLPSASPNVARSNHPVVLTSEQRAMIDAKRIEALKRRQQRMQQKAAPSNPYAK